MTRTDITTRKLAILRHGGAGTLAAQRGAMRTLALVLLPLSLLACVADVDQTADETVDDGGAADDPNVAYATGLKVSLTSAPPADGNSASVTFTYTTSKPATMTCRIDGQAYASCPATSKSYAGLSDGTHTFDLRASANGKRVAIPTYHFAIDTSAPTVAITSGPLQLTNSRSASFTFNAAGAASTTCSLDAGAAVACTSPAAYTALADGAHEFMVSGTDLAGNTTTAYDVWTVDGTAPTVTTSYNCDSSTGSIDLYWTATDNLSGVGSGSCSYGYETWDCTTGNSYSTNLRPSGTVFHASFTDHAGNTRSVSRTINNLACI